MLKKQVLKCLGQPHLPGSSPWAYSSVKDSDAVACGAETPIYDMRGPIHRSEGHRAEESRPDPAEGVMCEETVLHEEGHGLWQGRPVIENHSSTICLLADSRIRRASLSRIPGSAKNSHRGLPPGLPLLKDAEEAGALLLRVGEPAKTVSKTGAEWRA